MQISNIEFKKIYYILFAFCFLIACRKTQNGQAADLKANITKVVLDSAIVAEAFGVPANALKIKERSDSLTRTLFFSWFGEDSTKVSFTVNLQTANDSPKDSLHSFAKKIEHLKTKGLEPIADIGTEAAFGHLSPIMQLLAVRIEERLFINFQYMERGGGKNSQLKQENRREVLTHIAKTLIKNI